MVWELREGDAALETVIEEVRREFTNDAKLASTKPGIPAVVKMATPIKSLKILAFFALFAKNALTAAKGL
jgi:hypothetical protein